MVGIIPKKKIISRMSNVKMSNPRMSNDKMSNPSLVPRPSSRGVWGRD